VPTGSQWKEKVWIYAGRPDDGLVEIHQYDPTIQEVLILFQYSE